MSELRFRIGRVAVALRQAGPRVDLIGSYPTTGNVSGPVAQLNVRLSEDFLSNRVKSPAYPAFDSTMVSPDVLEVERFDARGRIDYGSSGAIRGDFEGHANPNTLEAIIRIVASISLPAQDTLILHASAIESDGFAHVFAGVSGAGKSTIAQLLGNNYAVEVLSDELLMLSKRDGTWWLDVAPFSGKIALPHGRSVPVASIHFLRQADSQQKVEMSLRESMRELPRHIVTYANHPTTLAAVLCLAGELVEAVPCFQLEFAKDPSIGELLQLPCL